MTWGLTGPASAAEIQLKDWGGVKSSKPMPAVKSTTLENWDSGLYQMSTAFPVGSEHMKYLTWPDQAENTSTISFDSSDKVLSSAGQSLNLNCTGVTSPATANGVGRVWVRPRDYDSNAVYYARQLTDLARANGTQETDADWEFNFYNRLRFWVKLPPGMPYPTLASGNDVRQQVGVGTYIRATDGDIADQESGGWHYYHGWLMGSTGEWQQCIMDFHPYTAREPEPAHDWADNQYPTQENGYNYFDLLTSLYIDAGLTTSGLVAPFDIKYDELEFYYDPNGEDTYYIHSMTGVYVPGTNMLQASWKTLNTPKTCEVVTSFNDIHASGWASATAQGTTAADSYKNHRFEVTDIDMGSNNSIYIAIRQQGETDFRQLRIPITQQGYDDTVMEHRA